MPYINVLANAKLFANVTSLFSVAHSIANFSCDLKHNLNEIKQWAFQLK